MFDVIAFGSATRDFFLRSKNFKVVKSDDFTTGQGICFDLGSKNQIDDIFFASGGGATNVSATFAYQGFKVGCVGKVGQDLGGESIKKELKQLKIKDLLVTDKNKITGHSIILSVSDKERTILNYPGACYDLTSEDVPFNKIKAKWFYIAPLAGNSAKSLLPIINYAKKNKIKVALNPGKDQLSLGLEGLKDVLESVDILNLNQEEGAKLAELPFEQENEIFKKLDEYVKGVVIMTKGKDGVVVSDGEYIYSAGTFQEEKFVDRTGAGDAFGSGFVSGMMRYGTVEEAIRLGTANGTAVVEVMGAKNGLLTRKRFETESRWNNLEINKVKL